jgi:hypothetical protein
MTAKPSIDPALRWIEQIDRAEPDLIRALLKMFVEALMHGRGRRDLRRRPWRAQQ